MARALALSVAVHAVAAVGLGVGISSWGGLPALPLAIDVSTVPIDELSELPLGLPPVGAKAAPKLATEPEPPAMPVPARPKPKRVPVRDPAAEPIAPHVKKDPRAPGTELAPKAAQGTPRASSVRSYAPAGSRVVALIRLDRLRGTAYAEPVDGVLQLLPDRRDLLEGTDIDLYRDITTLLVATPNPLDAFATLLVVRHRLRDEQLREALEKGAAATGRRLLWHTERGRPFAERVAAAAAPRVQSAPAPPAPDSRLPRRRDERLILLVAPRLVVVTPPSYRKLLLRGGSGAPREDDGWASLVNRIDAEDSILPANGVAMVSASDLLEAASTSGEATVMGLPAPRRVTAVLGIAPQPFANVDAEFGTPDGAAAWQREWPRLREPLLRNPLLVLTGLGHIIASVAVERENNILHVRVEATEDETVRILSFIATQLPLLRR